MSRTPVFSRPALQTARVLDSHVVCGLRNTAEAADALTHGLHFTVWAHSPAPLAAHRACRHRRKPGRWQERFLQCPRRAGLPRAYRPRADAGWRAPGWVRRDRLALAWRSPRMLTQNRQSRPDTIARRCDGHMSGGQRARRHGCGTQAMLSKPHTCAHKNVAQTDWIGISKRFLSRKRLR